MNSLDWWRRHNDGENLSTICLYPTSQVFADDLEDIEGKPCEVRLEAPTALKVKLHWRA